MRLLIAIGTTPHWEATLIFGGYIAQRLDPQPTILTVIEQQSDRPAANAFLAQAAETLAPFSQTVHRLVRVGQPVEEIIREAKDGGYGLVVLGERKRRGLISRFQSRSTAVQVVGNAPCSALIVKGTIRPLRKLLLCEGGDKSNSLVRRLVDQLSGLVAGKEEITVLHVMSQIGAGPGVRGKQLRASAQELIEEHSPEGQVLESDMQVLTERCTHCRPKVRHGLVVDEILAEARSGDYDLVVIGAHPGEGWQRFLLSDLASQIIIRIDRPILIMQPREPKRAP